MTQAREFERERRRLVSLAYRICGSWADAEDVVQQVAIEWMRSRESVMNSAGWLTRATVRRAIDALRTRQREATYIGPWVPEPMVEAPDADPYIEAERSDALTIAFLMLAESLTPPQRAVIVLRALGYEHAEVARILDVTPAMSRQHHVRGMRRLTAENGRTAYDDPSLFPHMSNDGSRSGEFQRQTSSLLGAFLSAARQGDTEALKRLLHEDVRAYNDGGGRTRAARRVLVGASNVARFAVGVASLHEDRRAMQPVTVSGAPGAIVTLSDIPHILSIQVRDGLIYRIFDVCNPDKQRSLRTIATEAPLTSTTA